MIHLLAPAILAVVAVATPPRQGARTGTAATATAAAPAPPMSDAEVAARVQSYLGVIDTPVSLQRWRALGARAMPALEAVLGDGAALPSRRAKAVDALSAIGGDRAAQLVLRAARSEAEPFVVRASAIRGTARVLAPAELPQTLRPILEGAHALSVRATAAEALAAAGSASCPAIQAQAAREGPRSRPQFARALQACGP